MITGSEMIFFFRLFSFLDGFIEDKHFCVFLPCWCPELVCSLLLLDNNTALLLVLKSKLS